MWGLEGSHAIFQQVEFPLNLSDILDENLGLGILRVQASPFGQDLQCSLAEAPEQSTLAPPYSGQNGLQGRKVTAIMIHDS